MLPEEGGLLKNFCSVNKMPWLMGGAVTVQDGAAVKPTRAVTDNATG